MQVLSPVDKLVGMSSTDLFGSDFNPERFGNMPKQYSLDALRQRSLLGPDTKLDSANKSINSGMHLHSTCFIILAADCI